MCLTIQETRHSIILARKHPTKHKNYGIPLSKRFRVAASDLTQKALKRPFLFLSTEAIIQFSALYNGYLYGLSFLFNSAFVIVFGSEGHGFDTIEVGLCFLGLIAGISIGPITNAIFQEPHFQRELRKNDFRNVPEGRVRMGKWAAVALPISLFWFAWTSYSTMPAIVPILASVLWGWAFYVLILMTYTYTEDSYKVHPLSSSSPLITNAQVDLFRLSTRRYRSHSESVWCCLPTFRYESVSRTRQPGRNELACGTGGVDGSYSVCVGAVWGEVEIEESVGKKAL
jgi:hypothetical protein